MPRFLWSAVLPVLVLTSGAAQCDEPRRTAFAAPLVGTWAPSADLCASKDGAIIISRHAYTSAGNRCRVGWVVETPGQSGPNYGVHATCARRHGKTVRTVDSIIRPEGERLLIGSSYETLRPYQRCQ